jgi:hypothetical protein
MRKGLLGSNMRILEWRVEWFDLRYTEAIRESVHSAGRYWWLVKGGVLGYTVHGNIRAIADSCLGELGEWSRRKEERGGEGNGREGERRREERGRKEVGCRR